MASEPLPPELFDRMSRKGSSFLAGVTILAGYLAADLFLSGVTAALAVLGLGAAEYLFLLVSRRTNHPGLLLEAALLGGAVLLGDWLSVRGFAGAEYAILELLLGAVLVSTSLAGKPWLASQMKRLAGFSPESGLVTGISVVMGGMLLVHGCLMAAGAIFMDGLPLPVALGSFAAVYIIAVLLLRRRMRSRSTGSQPMLTSIGDGRFKLIAGGSLIARITLDGRGRIVVSETDLEDGTPLHRFLEVLETALRTAGAFSVTMKDWEGDTLPLEMAGYTSGPAGWTKVLGRLRMT